VPSRSRARPPELKRSGPDLARSAIDDLFARPPAQEGEIPLRLRGVNPADARQVLVERLRMSEPTDQETELFMAIFGQLGVHEQRPAMAEIILDGGQSHRVRAYACGLLATEDPDLAEGLMARLPVEDRVAIMDVPFVDMLVWAQADPRAGEQLAIALEGLDGGAQGMTFDRLEVHRKRVGTGAVSAYGPALQRGRIRSLHRGMLEALVQESSPEGLELVRSLRDAEKEPSTRRSLQAALLRMGTRAIDPSVSREAPDGRAYVSSCDHLGDFIVLGCIDNPDGSVSVANICIRADAEIRGGFVLLRQTPQDLQEILEDLDRSGGGFAPLPLQEGARLVDDAVRRMEERGKKAPRDAEPAMALLRRATRRKRKPEPEIPPAWDVDPDQVRALMARPEHARIWILTQSDLDALHVLPPPSHGMDDAWIREAASLWARRSKRRNRLVAMARHMAMWHRVRGERDEAALCAGLVRMTEKRAASSPLVLGMIEKAFLLPLSEPVGLSDVDLRNFIRESLFDDALIPKGRDLARLDFTQIAYMSLGDTMADIDPTPLASDTQLAVAAAVANAFVDGRIGKKRPIDLGQVAYDVRGRVQALLTLNATTTEEVTRFLVATLDAFQREICSNCPVRCIDKPRARVGEHFRAPVHPAFPDCPF
jgi:hypothetical protein